MTEQGTGDLDRLLAVERELERMLTAAKAEADALVQAASDEAAREDSAGAAAVEAELARVRAEVDAAHAAQLEALRARADEIQARFEGVDEATFRRLVAHVVARTVGIAGDGEFHS